MAADGHTVKMQEKTEVEATREECAKGVNNVKKAVKVILLINP